MLAICLSAVPAFAVGACYTPPELTAEHLLRLHSELMVITVTCHTGSQGEDLVVAYTGFTHKNIRALHDAEATLIRFYKNNYGGSGVDRLDKLRTKLANEYGQKIADMSAPAYCARYRDKVLVMRTVSPPRLEDEVKHMTLVEKSYAYLCKEIDPLIAKNK